MSALVRVPEGAITATLGAIQRAGEGRRESAAFWIGRADTLVVDTVVLPLGDGVSCQPRSLRLSETWMVALAALCERRDAVVLAAVHAHPDEAFFSPVDRDAFFHAPDCVSIVLPSYGYTSTADAEARWAVFVGLPRNGWVRRRWQDVVDIVGGRAELVELEASC